MIADSAAGRPGRAPGLARRVAGLDLGAIAIAIPVVALAVLGWARRWAADDSYIDFRVIDNLLHGLGPVFNAGERVEAYTSPLWVALLTVVHVVLPFNLPWTAVVIGLAMSVAGLAAGSFAALRLWRGGAVEHRMALPLGAAVLVALPPVWDFSTSGLETGLVFAWLGFAFLALVRLWRMAPDVVAPWWARPAPFAVVVGLGPLIRPDLGIFSVRFLAVLLLVVPRRPKRLFRLRLVAWAVALPLAYQVFRMGYFAALVPNTAIAKEAGKADWSRGWAYLWDFLRPYGLYASIAVVAGSAVLAWRRAAHRPRALLVGLAPVVCGLVHTLYVVRVGGDFMHGRLLLPGLFGILLPVMVVAPARWRPIALAAVGATVTWAIVCAATLRDRYAGYPTLEARVVDERAFYVAAAHNGHPVSVADYRRAGQVRSGLFLRRRVGRFSILVLNPHPRPFGRDPVYRNPPAKRSLPNHVVGTYFAVGLVSYSAGHRVTIVDRHGIADPIAARLEFRPQIGPGGRLWPARYRAGHEKGLPLAWVVARYADLGTPATRRLARIPSIAEAVRALRCSRLHELLRAIDTPLTFNRFVSNIGVAWRLRSFRIAPEPNRAERELCG